MKILSYNPGHDGAIAFLQDSRLIFSIESEKDSNYRYSAVSVTDVLDAVGLLGDIPDVICMSGWWPLHHHEYLYGSHTTNPKSTFSSHVLVQTGGKFYDPSYGTGPFNSAVLWKNASVAGFFKVDMVAANNFRLVLREDPAGADMQVVDVKEI